MSVCCKPKKGCKRKLLGKFHVLNIFNWEQKVVILTSFSKQFMNHCSLTGTIRSNQGAGWQVGGGEGGASDPENPDRGEGEGGAAAAAGPEGGVLRCPEERDGGRSEEQGTGKCLLVIVGRVRMILKRGRGIVERGYGGTTRSYCKIVIKGDNSNFFSKM